jgi:hypothetical protein
MQAKWDTDLNQKWQAALRYSYLQEMTQNDKYTKQETPMTNKLEKYLAESAVEHEFRLKIAKEPTDEQLDAMELYLRKFDGYDIKTPKRTIVQKNPRDFRSIGATEVYMIDFKTKQPVSPHQLLAELTQKMGIHERFMIVRNKAEPLHVEEEDKETPEEKYKPRLGDDNYSEAEKVKQADFVGEKFKAKFIKEIAKNRVKHSTEYKGIKKK